MGLLDFFFPKYCIQCRKLGDYICANCFANISFDVRLMCLVCNKQAIDGRTHPGCRGRYTIDGMLASVVYAGVVRRLVYQFKYKPYVSDLSKTITELFYEGLIQQEQFHRLMRRESVLVPIPLHKSKEKMRGYNQSRILSENLSKLSDIPTADYLIRVRKTETQVDLKREKRLENIREAFGLATKAGSYLKGKQVLLIDDVITSGATMLEAAKVLKRNGADSVWGISLAHGV